MGQKGKFLLMEDGQLDLSQYVWDDHRFADILMREKGLDTDQAMAISRFLRQEIETLELPTITVPLIEQLIEAKFREYGLVKPASLRFDTSIFVRNGLSLSENARKVLERRYLKKDPDGTVLETPQQMFQRVAHHIASAEKNYGGEDRAREVAEIFYQLMVEAKFLPNSPTLMNAGRRLGQLAACFVLPVEDSMEGIFGALTNAAMIHKSGGGTGFSFSRLRPKDSNVGSTGGVASGPVSFMKIFNTATEQVKQGGTRRGANMAILRVDHPDILEFINCKQDPQSLNNFNISVGVTDGFMRALEAGSAYDLLDPRDGRKTGSLNAAEVYTLMVERAWANGDPGIIFLDRINRDNPTPELGAIESTNPCGEQPLLPMEACNLGSINLARFVSTETGTPAIDYETLKEVIGWSVRFPGQHHRHVALSPARNHRHGPGQPQDRAGGHGLCGPALPAGIPYNSEAALQIAAELMGFVQETAREASRTLARERGVFKNFDQSVFKGRKNGRLRNATTTTIAPTGTLSIIAGCSSGIEPLFALSFVRHVMDNDKLTEVNPHFEKTAVERGFYSPELMERIAARGTIQGMAEIPEEVRRVFVTAHDISPEWHIRMQAAFQQHTDNAVSKTVNLPHDASVADVRKVYDLAYELGCKGVTIYRDGSRENQVLSISRKAAADRGFMTLVKERPETLAGFTTRMMTGMGHLYVTVTEYEGRPFEVFATIGKSGRSTTAKTEAIGRLVSLALRSGVEVAEIVKQVKGIGGEYPVFQKGGLVLSIPDAIGRILEKRYLKKGAEGAPAKRSNSLLGETCPDCGQTISFEEGCMTCHFCGFSKCG
jgi:ribonucleoside-diphosphate reductase alpha chain